MGGGHWLREAGRRARGAWRGWAWKEACVGVIVAVGWETKGGKRGGGDGEAGLREQGGEGEAGWDRPPGGGGGGSAPLGLQGEPGRGCRPPPPPLRLWPRPLQYLGSPATQEGRAGGERCFRFLFPVHTPLLVRR